MPKRVSSVLPLLVSVLTLPLDAQVEDPPPTKIEQAVPKPAVPKPEVGAPPAALPQPEEAGPEGQPKEVAGKDGAKAQPQKESSPQIPEGLLATLGHEEFKRRLGAQNSLRQWGEKDLDGRIESIYRVYRSAENPEVRLRTRDVLKALVIVQQPFKGAGYLGIQMAPAQWKNEKGILQPVVRVTMVRVGTAAEIAKMKADDLVLGVDQVVFDDLAPTRMFADYIKSKSPGDVITLQVRRGDEKLELKASLRRRSPMLDELPLWGPMPVLPEQSELDENDFQDWLRTRAMAEKLRKKG